jgi:hypothetical protein
MNDTVSPWRRTRFIRVRSLAPNARAARTGTVVPTAIPVRKKSAAALLPIAEAASASTPRRPTMAVSTACIAICVPCPRIIGSARVNVARISVRMVPDKAVLIREPWERASP